MQRVFSICEATKQLSSTVPTAKAIAVECLLQLSTQYRGQYSPDSRPAMDTSQAVQYAHECRTLLRTMHPKRHASGLRDLISSHFDCVETLPLARAEYDELIKVREGQRLTELPAEICFAGGSIFNVISWIPRLTMTQKKKTSCGLWVTATRSPMTQLTGIGRSIMRDKTRCFH